MVRNKTLTTKKAVLEGGFVEGFNTDPSSEEESSDSEVEVEEAVEKRKKGRKKKATFKKSDGYKQTKATGSKHLHDDEGNVKKKKQNSKLSSSRTFYSGYII